ncbi:hypothetical protein [Acinetobacter sp. BSP-28]|uniref:hypothetical protein n=1 Tax=Acinetobacter sp. BSP-28 TaxID=3344661 RepID=UPI0037704601
MMNIKSTILFIIAASLFYFFVLERRFDGDSLMKENNQKIKLSSLTNFNWDTAQLSISNEDFEKITFYNKGIEVYREIIKFNFDDGYESQYLFSSSDSMKEAISAYECSYSSSIKLKKVEKVSEGKVTFYIYEPLDCIPIN